MEHVLRIPQTSNTEFSATLSVGILILLPLLTSIYPFIRYNYVSPSVSIRSLNAGGHSIVSRVLFLFVQYIITCLLYTSLSRTVRLQTFPGTCSNSTSICGAVFCPQDSLAFLIRLISTCSIWARSMYRVAPLCVAAKWMNESGKSFLRSEKSSSTATNVRAGDVYKRQQDRSRLPGFQVIQQ